MPSLSGCFVEEFCEALGLPIIDPLIGEVALMKSARNGLRILDADLGLATQIKSVGSAFYGKVENSVSQRVLCAPRILKQNCLLWFTGALSVRRR